MLGLKVIVIRMNFHLIRRNSIYIDNIFNKSFHISNLDINLGSLQNHLYTTIKYIKAMLDIFLHTSIQNAHHLPHMVMTVICISHDKRHTQVLP